MSIGEILAPNSLANIFIYIIFFMALITMLLIPDKNMTPTFMMAGVLLFTMIDKIRQLLEPNPNIGTEFYDSLQNDGFTTLLLHIAMFVLPFMTAGMIRGRQPKDKRGVPIAILCGIVAALYAAGAFVVTDLFYNTF